MQPYLLRIFDCRNFRIPYAQPSQTPPYVFSKEPKVRSYPDRDNRQIEGVGADIQICHIFLRSCAISASSSLSFSFIFMPHHFSLSFLIFLAPIDQFFIFLLFLPIPLLLGSARCVRLWRP